VRNGIQLTESTTASARGVGAQFALTAKQRITDALAGGLGAIALIANIISFGALMFPGELSAGAPFAIWAMLIGSSIGGIVIAVLTSLAPITTGIDSPTGAFLVVISATTSSAVLAAGGSPSVAIQTVMIIFTAATLVSGLLLFTLGTMRWGTYFRFVPYSVVGGFLGATGWFLLAGGLRLATGRRFNIFNFIDAWSWADSLRVATSILVLLILLSVKKWIKSPLAMPFALVAIWGAATIVLYSFGATDPARGWYLRSLGSLVPWNPFEAWQHDQVSLHRPVLIVLELIAVTIVALISLIAKVASIEVARQTSGDLDREFRAHGIANLAAGFAGGIACSLQIGTSRLLEQLGATSRFSSICSALVLGGVGLASFDLPGWVPIPVIAGLIFLLGQTFLHDAFARPILQRAWLDIALSVAIMAVCVQYGYLLGVLAGLVAACILFAINYARLGVIRRHATRAQYAGYVVRSKTESDYLRETGGAIQIYWLNGYIFFGSSESVFERIRGDIEAASGKISYIILDFSLVSNTDSSAILSLTKLRSFCDKRDVIIVYCSLSPRNRRALALRGFFGEKSRHQSFENLNVALAWCEDEVLANAGIGLDTNPVAFEKWLQDQLGSSASAADFLKYLQRKSFEGPEVLYHEGDPSDTIDFVATGQLVIDIRGENDARIRVRRIAMHSVVGEMGFFRKISRSATVSSAGPATIYTLSRTNFERLRAERPELASAFDDLIKRILSDRIDFANREVLALSR
jgi:SulP family sulfate permease